MVLVFLALLAVFLFGVAVVFVVVVVKLAAAEDRGDTVRQTVAAGDTSGLAEWSPELLPWLSKDSVGSSSYFRPMGGSLTSKVALTLFSVQGAALVALSGEVTRRKGRGRIDLLVRGTRIVLQLDRGSWFVSANGSALGVIEPTSGRLDDAQGRPVGFCLHGGGGTRLQLRGVDIGWIAAGAAIHEDRVANPRPLLRLAAPLTETEPVLWLLAAIAFTLFNELVVGSSGLMAV